MTELYQTVRDGYVAGRVATGAAKPRGAMRLPSYLRGPASPEQAKAELRRLMQRAGKEPGVDPGLRFNPLGDA